MPGLMPQVGNVGGVDSNLAIGGTIAGALSQGFASFIQAKKDREERDERKLDRLNRTGLLKMNAREKGLIYNDDTGEVSEGPGYISPRELEQKKYQEQLQLRREEMQQRNEMRRFQIEQSGLLRQMSQQNVNMATQEKRDKNLETDVQKFSDSISPAQEIQDALSGVEKNLGFPLDSAESVKDKGLLVNGKPVDLPGVSIPGYGRLSNYSSDARSLDTAVAKIFNTELKDRSGATVTNKEMDRLRQEFASGKFNTEAEMVQALKEYKRAAAAALKNKEAAFRPEVVGKYRERGGKTYRDVDSTGGLIKPSNGWGEDKEKELQELYKLRGD